MAHRPITLTTAYDRGAVIFLVDSDGEHLPVVMPNRDGAVFCAAALKLECNRARRAGE